VRSFATGGFHGCAVDGDGGVTCWGGNVLSQTCLVNGLRYLDNATPVAQLAGARHVGASWGGTCAALEPDGRVVCCGLDDSRQTGAPDASDCSGRACTGPTRVGSVQNAVQVAVGNGHACAVLSTGEIVCWGADDHGQLGVAPDGGVKATCTNMSAAVVPCSEVPPTSVTAPGSSFVQVAVSDGTTCGLTAAGQVLCWGSNEVNELGRGHGRSSGPNPVPDLVLVGQGAALSSVVGIFAHNGMACGVVASGDVYCWGGGGAGVYADAAVEETYATLVPR
jgi:alpha-tubulin suppressor-like RCC1 family protein